MLSQRTYCFDIGPIASDVGNLLDLDQEEPIEEILWDHKLILVHDDNDSQSAPYIVYVSPNISGSQANSGINITPVCITIPVCISLENPCGSLDRLIICYNRYTRPPPCPPSKVWLTIKYSSDMMSLTKRVEFRLYLCNNLNV